MHQARPFGLPGRQALGRGSPRGGAPGGGRCPPGRGGGGGQAGARQPRLDQAAGQVDVHRRHPLRALLGRRRGSRRRPGGWPGGGAALHDGARARAHVAGWRRGRAAPRPELRGVGAGRGLAQGGAAGPTDRGWRRRRRGSAPRPILCGVRPGRGVAPRRAAGPATRLARAGRRLEALLRRHVDGV